MAGFPKSESGEISLSTSPVTGQHSYEAGFQGLHKQGSVTIKEERGEAEDLSMSRRGSSQELPGYDYMDAPRDMR